MLGGPEGVIILVIILVLFGGSQLPKLARNLGSAQKEFRSAMEEANGTKPVTPVDPAPSADLASGSDALPGPSGTPEPAPEKPAGS